MKRLLSDLSTALPPLPALGQGVLLVDYAPACANLIGRMLMSEPGLLVQRVASPLHPRDLPVDERFGGIVIAAEELGPLLLSLVDGVSLGHPEMPVVVVLSRLDEQSESELILAGAAECLGLSGLDGWGLVRCLRRANLRRRRALETRRKSDATLEAVRVNLDQAQRVGHVGIWEWDIVSGELWFSDEAHRILGLPGSSGPISYQQLLDAVHDEDRASVEAALDCSLTSLTRYQVEHRLCWPDASVRFVRQEGEVAVDEAGRPTRMVGTMLDITRRRQVEEALNAAQDHLERRVRERTRALLQEIAQRQRAQTVLRESEQRIRTITDALPGLIAYIDIDRHFQFANRRYEEWLGIPQELLIGRPVAEVMGADLYVTMAPFIDVVMSGSEVSHEGWMTTLTGGMRAYQATYLPDKGADGAVNGYFSLILDVTTSRMAEQQLRSAKEAAELADRAKTEFLANMSHELRTPLNAIIGFSDIMHSEIMGPVGNDAYRGYVSDILDSGRHLLEVINEILDMSKVEAGHVELHAQEVSLSELARVTLRLMRERAEQGKIAIDNAVRDDLPPVMVDERRFKQILLNLLSNAVKFTPPGGTVHLWTEPGEDGGLVVAVSDDGIGMDAQGIDKALSPFGQVESSLSRRYDGTGLGLPLTKAFTELHGGTLDIISAPGKGTTVRVCLPRNRVMR